jgi:hypothetical protein
MANHPGITEVGQHADEYKFPTQDEIDTALKLIQRLLQHTDVKAALAKAEAEAKVGAPEVGTKGIGTSA